MRWTCQERSALKGAAPWAKAATAALRASAQPRRHLHPPVQPLMLVVENFPT